MAPQDAPRTRPRRLQKGSKTTSNRFEGDFASYISFGTPKLPPHGFQKHSKTLLERILAPHQDLRVASMAHEDAAYIPPLILTKLTP